MCSGFCLHSWKIYLYVKKYIDWIPLRKNIGRARLCRNLSFKVS
ncbi:unnamed protein product [Acanthoscelides obtectus]|uniref:Uncharacterized protein n=1 Tax=Acanthoscelides obtectus TaxID=200917 RepID=A0A9P0K5H4_ACAOB|nr:unnamed protein product [Acanthoscelides obtectus]CAK1622914.1 hypothetical protein AOBTE_LOCUS1727 [Acanthoscelides obtectus]